MPLQADVATGASQQTTIVGVGSIRIPAVLPVDTTGTPVPAVPATPSAATVSLSAVSAAGPGSVLDNTVFRSNHTMVVVSSVGVTAGAVQLQGSLDNTNWFNVGTAVSTTTASTVFPPVVASNQPIRYLRANVTTPITGGTVSASVVSTL